MPEYLRENRPGKFDPVLLLAQLNQEQLSRARAHIEEDQEPEVPEAAPLTEAQKVEQSTASQAATEEAKADAV